MVAAKLHDVIQPPAKELNAVHRYNSAAAMQPVTEGHMYLQCDWWLMLRCLNYCSWLHKYLN